MYQNKIKCNKIREFTKGEIKFKAKTFMTRGFNVSKNNHKKVMTMNKNAVINIASN